MRKFLCITLISLLTIHVSRAQSPAWSFLNNGAGVGDDQMTDMKTDHASDIIFVGQADTNYFDYAGVIMKLSETGSVKWKRFLNIAGANPNAFVIDNDNNIYLTGYFVPAPYSEDFFITKYNAAGTQLWLKYYAVNGGGGAEGDAISIDHQGNIITTGLSKTQASAKGVLAIKYDTAGNQLWLKTFDNPDSTDNTVTCMALDANDNLFIGGNSVTKGTGNRDFLTLKMDTAGALQWFKTYDDSLHLDDEISALTIDNNNNVIVTGESYGLGYGSFNVYRFATVKYNNAGVQQWVKRYEGANSTSFPQDVITDASGNIIVAGSSYFNSTGFDGTLIKYDPSGNVIWSRFFDGTQHDNDACWKLKMDNNGNLFIGGYTVSAGLNQYDGLCLIYDANGNLLNHLAYDDTAHNKDYYSFISLDEDGNIVLGGSEEYFGGITHFLVVKYAASVGVKDISPVSAVSIYPNPSSQWVIVNNPFTVNKETGVKIYDAMGKEVYSSIITTPSLRLQTARFPDGIYFAQLTAGDEMRTQKLVIQH